jgi:predicted membrane protein
MSEILIYTLLFFALILPVPGAIALRAFAPRLGQRRLVAGLMVLFGVAMLCVVLIGLADVRSLRIGGLSLLQPATRFSDEFNLPSP